MLDSQPWKMAEMAQAAARMPFRLDGDAVPTSRTSSRRSWLSTADGIVCRVEESTVRIEDESVVALRHSIPRAARNRRFKSLRL